MNWMPKPKYPIKEQLPRIKQHEQLPTGAVELARVNDPNSSNTVFLFIRKGKHLSILKADIKPRKLRNGTFLYTCGQADYPLGMLSWFGDALSEFQKPPAEGGLHSGGMTGPDEEVEGEMLCIQRAMNAAPGTGGYSVINRSRKDHSVSLEGFFRPHETLFADNFLYEAGLLNQIKVLGDKYRRGEL